MLPWEFGSMSGFGAEVEKKQESQAGLWCGRQES